METNLAEKHWYVVNTYSMHERKVADNLLKRVETMGLSDRILDIIVCEEEVPVLKEGMPQVDKDGHPKTKMKNLYPGYIFVEMILTDEIWYIVRNTPGVTGITGSSGGGQKPSPVSNEQMEPILKRVGKVDMSMYDRYSVGDLVKVIHGPLDGTEGTIQSIDKETGAVRVLTVFFGRETPVDVEFSEIEKVQ
ncbi:MAG: transcription termination/antitermination protein NusG [Bacilli bacterium]|nr:transcription termination/antitermination protein NusG [Bacilli bacterium]